MSSKVFQLAEKLNENLRAPFGFSDNRVKFGVDGLFQGKYSTEKQDKQSI